MNNEIIFEYFVFIPNFEIYNTLYGAQNLDVEVIYRENRGNSTFLNDKLDYS